MTFKLRFVFSVIFIISNVVKCEVCYIEEETNYFTSIRKVECNSNEKCCNEGCCKIEFIIETWSNRFSPFLGFFLLVIIAGYLFICGRYCYKKCFKKLDRTPSVTFSRANTQPQELNLMLSFNQNNGVERLNFENLSNAHLHVPYMPATPRTPPPAYVTLTPPPTYSVAIHFPEFLAQRAEETQQSVNNSKENV